MTEREETLEEVLKILRVKLASIKDMDPPLLSFYAGIKRGIEYCIEDIESLKK